MAAIISGRPGSEGFRAYIETLAGSPEIKGVRQVLHVPSAPKSHCLTESFVSSMKLLGELNLNFDFCIRPTELADAAALARKCPGTRFVVDHCGNADPKAFGALAKTTKEEPWHDEAGWRRDIAELAQIENVYCKISGIVARNHIVPPTATANASPRQRSGTARTEALPSTKYSPPTNTIARYGTQPTWCTDHENHAM